jgi:hypothetical protein
MGLVLGCGSAWASDESLEKWMGAMADACLRMEELAQPTKQSSMDTIWIGSHIFGYQENECRLFHPSYENLQMLALRTVDPLAAG